MRRVFAVAALSLFVALSMPAAERGRNPPEKDPPLVKFVRMVKKAVRSLGDGVVTPRP